MPRPSLSPTTSLKGREFLAKVAGEAFPERVSLAVGVGHFSSGAGAALSSAAPASDQPCLPATADGLGWVSRLAFGLAVGVGQSRNRFAGLGLPRTVCSRSPRPPLSAMVALGVGNQPEPVAAVRGAKVGRGYTIPPSIVPERSEAPEHLVQSAMAKGRDVFDDGPFRAEFTDDPGVLPPEAGAFSREARARSREADVLARKSTADEVGTTGAGGHEFIIIAPRQRSHVVEKHRVPMIGQDASAIFIRFAERHGFHAGPLKAEREGANAGKQVEHLHFV